LHLSYLVHKPQSIHSILSSTFLSSSRSIEAMSRQFLVGLFCLYLCFASVSCITFTYYNDSACTVMLPVGHAVSGTNGIVNNPYQFGLSQCAFDPNLNGNGGSQAFMISSCQASTTAKPYGDVTYTPYSTQDCSHAMTAVVYSNVTNACTPAGGAKGVWVKRVCGTNPTSTSFAKASVYTDSACTMMGSGTALGALTTNPENIAVGSCASLTGNSNTESVIPYSCISGSSITISIYNANSGCMGTNSTQVFNDGQCFSIGNGNYEMISCTNAGQLSATFHVSTLISISFLLLLSFYLMF